ncbi:MAG: hypothetical protein R2865_12055 [Deinococcales bacterium]
MKISILACLWVTITYTFESSEKADLAFSIRSGQPTNLNLP